MRIPLGTYDIEEANRIVERMNESRQYPERHVYRENYWVTKRARGIRNIYIKDETCSSGFNRIKNSNGDIPLKYAQKVALYLIIPDKKIKVVRDNSNKATIFKGKRMTEVPLFAVQEVVTAIHQLQ